ncbi:VOC family protein [Amycolatopsis thermoflava]|uniref:VOC family protein n=1 Tax=Amycolatopsis thermoflava TaxID=84480 RepID=UPI0004066938|nr:VOC family protein [Amycolatopsis thermoflava]
MSSVDTNQPEGTPTWMALTAPDLPRATAFYGAVFGWTTRDDLFLLGDRVAAGFAEGAPAWTTYLATADCDATAKRVRAAGGQVVEGPTEFGGRARIALAVDPVGARFGLWQGRELPGCQVVNEPGSLVRNDLTTARPEHARAFYPQVFGFTLDRNADLPELDFTFLRRPDGHEVGGIMGVPGPADSRWATTFEVADTDETIARALAAGGKSTEPEDFVYGRMATITDPSGVEFGVIARA